MEEELLREVLGRLDSDRALAEPVADLVLASLDSLSGLSDNSAYAHDRSSGERRQSP